MSVAAPAQSDNQAAFDALQRMGESATLQEIADELVVLAKIREGHRQADAGQLVTHDEVVRTSAAWTRG